MAVCGSSTRKVSIPLGDRLMWPSRGAVATKKTFCFSMKAFISGVISSKNLDIAATSTLAFHNFAFQAIHDGEELFAFAVRHFELRQRALDVVHRDVPLVRIDRQTRVRRLHVLTEVES